MAAEATRHLGVSLSVILNRTLGDDTEAMAFLDEHKLSLLGCIPDDRQVAECAARGGIPYRDVPSFAETIRQVLDRLLEVTRS